jgi:hypothetical protein
MLQSFFIPTEEIVQLTTVIIIGANANQKGCNIGFGNMMVCNTFTHVTCLVGLLRTGPTARNPTTRKPLPLVNNITAITELEMEEDAIIILQNKITCLDDMSLEGDIPDDVSDIVEVLEKALFVGS